MVVSDGPSSQLRAAGWVVCLHSTCWALELKMKQARLPSSGSKQYIYLDKEAEKILLIYIKDYIPCPCHHVRGGTGLRSCSSSTPSASSETRPGLLSTACKVS